MWEIINKISIKFFKNEEKISDKFFGLKINFMSLSLNLNFVKKLKF